MNPLEEQFNKVSLKLSNDRIGRFIPADSQLDSRLLDFLDERLVGMRRTIQEGFIGDVLPGAKEVYIDYVDSKEPNAWAHGGDFNCIGINYGFVLSIFDYYNTLMCCKDVFLEIGKPENEVYTFEELKDTLKNISNQFQFSYEPQSVERVEMATLMARVAVYFVLGHELTHVLKHGLFFQKKYQQEVIYEYYDPKIFSSKDYIDLKALELDADRNGSLLSFWLLDFYFKDASTQLEERFEGPSYLWLTSIVTLLYLLENATNFYYPNKVSSHPVARIRQIFCIQFIRIAAPQLDVFYGLDMNQTLVNHLDELEKLIARISIHSDASRNSKMEWEYALLIKHLEFMQKNYLDPT